MQMLNAMNQDLDMNPELKPPLSICVDGGMTKNKFMLQLQADILEIELKKGETSCIIPISTSVYRE